MQDAGDREPMIKPHITELASQLRCTYVHYNRGTVFFQTGSIIRLKFSHFQLTSCRNKLFYERRP